MTRPNKNEVGAFFGYRYISDFGLRCSDGDISAQENPRANSNLPNAVHGRREESAYRRSVQRAVACVAKGKADADART